MTLPPTSQEPESDPWSVSSQEKKGNPLPRWLPISLLALTTAALAVPVLLLRRQRNNALAKALKTGPPPPRRSASVPVGTPIRQPTSSGSSSISTHSPQPPKPVKDLPSQPSDDFNGALYSAKAFGIATVSVTVGATAIIWGAKTAMGVKDTDEFAYRMRQAVLSRMPLLSSRIYRQPGPEDHGLEGDLVSLPLETETNVDTGAWSWSAAEERLKTAFEKDGFSGWAEAAMQELEAEGKIERIRRGHS